MIKPLLIRIVLMALVALAGGRPSSPGNPEVQGVPPSTAAAVRIGDNGTTINRNQFERVVKALEPERFGGVDEASCAYNVPDNPTDVLPQTLGFGVGYEFIRLAREAYRFELVAAQIIAPMIEDIAFNHALTDDFAERSRLLRKLNTLITEGLLFNFKMIVSAQVCIHDRRRIGELALCEGASRNDTIFSDKNFNLLHRFPIMDVFYFVDLNKPPKSAASPTNETSTHKVRPNSRETEVGWWFGPTLCPSDRFKMVYIVPLHQSRALMDSKGMLIIEFNISMIELDQCDPAKPFGSTNKCPVGTKCLNNPGRGFQIGSYNCVCSSPAGHEFAFSGRELEQQYLNRSLAEAWCPYTCLSSTRCFVRLSRVLRIVITSIQSLCIVLAVVEMILVFRKRHHNAMKSTIWTLTEALLVGTICIHLSVIVMALDTTVITCLAYSWLREIGFITVYGTLVLRLYKLLAEFQSRKARSVQIKNKDMIRYLLLMIFITAFYLLAWTLVNLDHASDPRIAINLLYYGRTKSGHDFVACQLRWWDYLIEVAEFAFLCTALRLLYSTKTAPPSEYKERKFIAFAIYLEISISTLCNLTRLGIWKTVHSDAILIMYFFRSHFTITTSILFNMYRRVLCSLCFGYSQNDDLRFKSMQDMSGETDFSGFKICNNGDVSSIAEMDPETIKTELKRLYSQLHQLKTEQMKRCNPHLIRKTNRKKNRRLSVQTLRHRGNIHTTCPATPDIEISHHKTPRPSLTSSVNVEKSEIEHAQK